jgi:hypothetical protein
MKQKENVVKPNKIQSASIIEHKVFYQQKTISLGECLEQLRIQKLIGPKGMRNR